MDLDGFKQRFQLNPGSGSTPSRAPLQAPCVGGGFFWVTLSVSSAPGAVVELWLTEWDDSNPGADWSPLCVQTGSGSSEVRVVNAGSQLVLRNYAAVSPQVYVIFAPVSSPGRV